MLPRYNPDFVDILNNLEMFRRRVLVNRYVIIKEMILNYTDVTKEFQNPLLKPRAPSQGAF